MITSSQALAALELGFAPVPVRADGSKAPLVLWRSINEHGGPSAEQVAEWFETPQLGWGLLCGDASGGLELFEVEARAMSDGTFDQWRWAVHEAGLGRLVERIRDGYCEASPSGGWHLLYRVPGAVKPNTRLAANENGEPLFESRGQGGFVVIAPSSGSTHPSGRPWRLVRGGLDTVATIGADERDAIWELTRYFDLRRKAEPPASMPERQWQPLPAHRWMDAVIADFNAQRSWNEVLDGWIVHHETAGITYWTRPGKDPHEGWSATTNANGTDRLIVFTSADVGGFEPWDGAGPATSYDRFGAWAILAHHGDRVAAAAELRRHHSAPVAPVAPPGAEGDQPSVLSQLIDWPAFWAQDRSAADWLFSPVLARGRGHAIFAKHKVGKSRIALWLAVELATGTEDDVRVLYLDFEMTEDDLAERLEDMGYGPDSDLSRLGYALLPALPNLDTVEGGTVLLELVEAFRADVVVIDTMGRAVGGEENSADTYRAFYEHTGRPLKQRGVTYARLDHAGKDPTAGQRGSSAKGDDVDVVWEVTSMDGGLRLRRNAARMGWVPAEVKLHETDEGFEVKALEWPEGTEELAQRLFLLGVDAEDPISAAQEKLRGAGEGRRRSLIVAAQQYRRARSEPGTAGGNRDFRGSEG